MRVYARAPYRHRAIQPTPPHSQRRRDSVSQTARVNATRPVAEPLARRPNGHTTGRRGEATHGCGGREGGGGEEERRPAPNVVSAAPAASLVAANGIEERRRRSGSDDGAGESRGEEQSGGEGGGGGCPTVHGGGRLEGGEERRRKRRGGARHTRTTPTAQPAALMGGRSHEALDTLSTRRQHVSKESCGAPAAYMAEKPFLSPPAERMTLSMLKRTVLDSGLHCPARISSPGFTRKAGDTCTGVFLWRFSKRLYFLM